MSERIRLTEAERSYGRVDPGLQMRGRWYSEASVERIVADRVAQAKPPHVHYPTCWCGRDHWDPGQ